MSSETVIKIENVGKKYVIRHKNEKIEEAPNAVSRILRSVKELPKRNIKEDFWALNDINLEIKKGESIGIIGKNGAGKSTLLKLLSRITEPTTGKIEITGKVSAMLEVGTGFNMELTGRENVYLNGAILGMKKDEIDAKLDDIVAFSEVDKFLDTPVKRYSSGMFVRLAFAVASHLEPDIMVVDEVLAVGDTKFQKKCLEQMARVASNGRTVLYVSHNMATIRQLCSRVIFLKGGKVDFVGDVEDGIKRYFETGGANETLRDLSDIRRGTWVSGQAKLLSIEMLDTSDCVYRYDEPIHFRLKFMANDNVDNVTLRFNLADSNTDHVGASFSKSIGSIEKGREYSLDCRFEGHTLAPNSYNASITISKGNNFVGYSSLDAVFPTFTFDVLGRENEIGRETWHSSWGNIHLPELEITVE